MQYFYFIIMMKKELVCAQPHQAISMASSIELASNI